MPLKDHVIKGRDKFEPADLSLALAFPCCACKYRHVEDDQDEPCVSCDYNLNARPEAENAGGEHG